MNINYEESCTKSGDGVALYVQAWKPENPQKKLFICHGYAEHGKRYDEFAHHCAQEGIETWTVDLRGHGKSEGARGFVDDFNHYLDDVQTLIDDNKSELPCFLLGHSLGGLICLNYAQERGEGLSGLLISNPYLGLAMKVPALKLKVADLAAKYAPRLSLPSGLDPKGISHDQAIVDAYRNDPLVFTTANAAWNREAVSAQERVLQKHAFSMPVFFAYSDADPITCGKTNADYAEKIQAPKTEVVLRAGEFHEIMNETNRQELHAMMSKWIMETGN